ncbi:hypothetical protein [Streptomyces sp. AC1-42T]|uniref:hypothetical protein n=1 Tax=Streptomyces sp. AC1-42T TaxID=2218665 RepID=UPI0018F5EDC9|nr:hypothetical protein [Streptomyces sp. AC1-42T]
MFLAVVGLVGPAWALHEQATPLFDGAGHRPSAIAADASPSSDRCGRSGSSAIGPPRNRTPSAIWNIHA